MSIPRTSTDEKNKELSDLYLESLDEILEQCPSQIQPRPYEVVDYMLEHKRIKIPLTRRRVLDCIRLSGKTKSKSYKIKEMADLIIIVKEIKSKPLTPASKARLENIRKKAHAIADLHAGVESIKESYKEIQSLVND